LLNFPDPPAQSTSSVARRSALRETPLGEELSQRVGEALDFTTIEQLAEDARLDAAPRTGSLLDQFVNREGILPQLRNPIVGKREGFMTKDEYEASPHFREGIEWDQRMTPDRAEALAEIVEKRKYRESLFERSPGGVGRALAGFGASLVGSAPDPINYVPILGPGARGVAATRLGVIGGRAAVGVAEGAIGTALVSPFIAMNINKKGGDVTATDVAMDIAFGALLGGAFGAGSGVLAKRKAAKALRSSGAKTQIDALSAAAEDLTDGDPVDVRDLVKDDIARVRDGAQLRRRPPSADRRPEEPSATVEAPVAAEADLSARLKQSADRISGDKLAEEIDLPSTQVLTRKGKQVTHKGPMDIVTFIRANQGLKDSGGELKSRDLKQTTTGRTEIDFVGREATYGRLVDDSDGMTLENATLKAWEAGYFPGKADRPTPDDLLEAIDRTLAADGDLEGRVFSENDFGVLERLRQQRDEADIIAENAARDREVANGSDGAPGRVVDDTDLSDDPAEVSLRGEVDIDTSVERQPDIEDIPFFDEASQSVHGRQSAANDDASDLPDVKDDDAVLAEIASMRSLGELSEEEVALLDNANDNADQMEKYAEGYETLAGCVLRHG